MKDETKSINVGRGDQHHFGAVNMPVYHASTILYPSLAALRKRTDMPYSYARKGTPSSNALEKAVATLEGGADCVLTPSGLAGLTLAFLAVVKAGDHILITDSVYAPTRALCDDYFPSLDIECEYYDPLIGGDIERLVRPNTSLIFTESPGSQTFEVQDIPAICAVARARGITTIIDNTWGALLHFNPFAHGIDISVQAATKYIVGHADAMLGTVTSTAAIAEQVRNAHKQFGFCAAPDDVFLALRGIRTLPLRLQKHQESALVIARWLESLPFVRRVLFPALESSAGHELWKRDFKGAAGLFSFELEPCSEAQLAAMLDNMAHFAMGYSWGGFESLIIPCAFTRTIGETYNTDGQYLRVHIGLEHCDDLLADLAAGFARAGFSVL